MKQNQRTLNYKIVQHRLHIMIGRKEFVLCVMGNIHISICIPICAKIVEDLNMTLRIVDAEMRISVSIQPWRDLLWILYDHYFVYIVSLNIDSYVVLRNFIVNNTVQTIISWI